VQNMAEQLQVMGLNRSVWRPKEQQTRNPNHLGRIRVLRFFWINVTTNPTAEWIARQTTEAFPWDDAPKYLIRDRDQIYGAVVTRRLRAMGIRDKPTAPASPWQNACAA
jgi:hypothetical protein